LIRARQCQRTQRVNAFPVMARGSGGR
jgi:hypothetical protein